MNTFTEMQLFITLLLFVSMGFFSGFMAGMKKARKKNNDPD